MSEYTSEIDIRGICEEVDRHGGNQHTAPVLSYTALGPDGAISAAARGELVFPSEPWHPEIDPFGRIDSWSRRLDESEHSSQTSEHDVSLRPFQQLLGFATGLVTHDHQSQAHTRIYTWLQDIALPAHSPIPTIHHEQTWSSITRHQNALVNAATGIGNFGYAGGHSSIQSFLPIPRHQYYGAQRPYQHQAGAAEFEQDTTQSATNLLTSAAHHGHDQSGEVDSYFAQHHPGYIPLNSVMANDHSGSDLGDRDVPEHLSIFGRRARQ